MTNRARLVYAVKVTVAAVLYYSGVLWLWRRVALRERAIVLTYHRVLTPEERDRSGSHPAIVVDRDTFARQMALLKRHFNVISVAEFAKHVEERIPFPSSSCVITFDDGWRDNFTNALPILARHELPSLIFLPVNYIGSARIFWQEALVHLLTAAVRIARTDPSQRARLAALLAGRDLADVLDLADEALRPRIVRAIATLKRLSRASMERFLAELSHATGTSLEELAAIDGFMDWQQVADMARQRVSFGGHGAEHLLLTYVSEGEAAEEIGTSKRELAARLGERVPTFSYPNGYVTPELTTMVERAGYRLAFGTGGGGRVSCDHARFTIARLNVHESVTATMPMFMARIVGLW